MWICRKWKTWYLSLGGSCGTHWCARQRSVHVHVTCSKRPELSRSIVGPRTTWYGVKLVDTRRRAGSTHFVSATIASRAVMASPKRWTVGETVAYAFRGVPSPTEEPEGKNGRLATAGAAATSAAAVASSAARLMRALRATSRAGR